MSYSRQAFSGLSWVTAGRATVRAATVIKTIVLARILTPSQFGLFGIAALILALLEIITETGINVFLIQEKTGIDDYLDTAWITSILRGFIISIVLLVVAHPIAQFFNTPQVSGLITLSALVPFIRGFINPAVISLQKNLKFSREFTIKAFITIIELGVAISVSIYTKSASALVWSMIASALAEVAITHLFIIPRPHLIWNKLKFLKVLNRGKWVTMSGLFNYLFQEGDDIVVGKIIDATNLGLYQTAYKIAILPLSEIVDVFGRVTFPIFSNISSDQERLKRAFTKVTLAITALTLPLSVGIFLFSDQLISLLLGSAWLPASPALRVLSIFALIRSISGSSTSLFMALKKQHYVTAITLISLLGLGITVVPLVRNFGLVGAAFSALIGSILPVPFIIYALVKIFTHAKSQS